MATKNSGDLAPGTSYTLGNYTFRTGAAYDSQRNETDITAICRLEGDSPAKQGIVNLTKDGEYSLVSWSVEANSTTADVYVTVKKHATRLTTGPIETIKLTANERVVTGIGADGHIYPDTEYAITPHYEFEHTLLNGSTHGVSAMAEEASGTGMDHGWINRGGGAGSAILIRTFTYAGKTVYYLDYDATYYGASAMNLGIIPTSYVTPNRADYLAWDIVYGLGDGETEKILLARFAIDLHEAGGTGPESDWDDPGDWNEDPDTVLNLTVEGALSGRHNDYLFDPTFSYTPAENEAKADYGCGGNGGHGGGGGAGASTVVIKDFATNRANRMQGIPIAKRHGYGSGGGKGAQGGPGCILIYY